MEMAGGILAGAMFRHHGCIASVAVRRSGTLKIKETVRV
jgi:hypothetical protein